MKKLFLIVAVLLLAGCRSQQTLLSGVTEEQLYLDRVTGLKAVYHDGYFYYVLWAANTQRYIFSQVPYYNALSMIKLPKQKLITPEKK